MAEIVYKPPLENDGKYRFEVETFDNDLDNITLQSLQVIKVDGVDVNPYVPNWLNKAMVEILPKAPDRSQFNIKMEVPKVLAPEVPTEFTLRALISDGIGPDVAGDFIIRFFSP